MALDAVIFDIDGTLIDSNPAHVEAWRIAFESHGYRIAADRVESPAGLRRGVGREGVDEQGAPIHVDDPREPQLTALARRYPEDPLAFVRVRELFGDIADDPGFSRPYLAALASLHAVGTRATLERLLEA